MIQLTLFHTPAEDKISMPVLLVERVHYTFEQWVEHVREFTIPSLNTDVDSHLRSIYVLQCWEDEYKWKEWCNAVEKEG